jgi:hypothetical protein
MSYLDIQLTAYTSTTASFIQPDVAGSVDVPVISTGWMPLGVALFISGAGYYTIERVLDATRVRVINTGGTGCASEGTIVPANARVIAVGQGGGGGGGAAVISRTRYVDQHTAVAEADQTGSSSAPFATLAAAISSLLDEESASPAEGAGYNVILFPGDYSAETLPDWDPASAEHHEGLSISAAIPTYVSAGVPASGAVVGTLVGTVGILSLSGVYLVGGATGFSGITAADCSIAGVVTTTGSLFASGCNFNQPNLQCGDLSMRGGDASISDSTLVISGTQVVIDGCNAQIANLTFSGSAGTLLVDGMTDYRLSQAGGVTITNGTKAVMA